MVRTSPTTSPTTLQREITIDLLALDLTTCGRCTRTDANLDGALQTVTERLGREGVRVKVQKTVVQSAEQAERLRFVSSPTIRVNGKDIALELRESDCGDCGELCGCAADVTCRVWVWKGREYLEAPQPLIVDAVMHAYRAGGSAPPAVSGPFRLPENLRKFFAAKTMGAGTAKSGCCDRTTCCAPSEREACCGSGAGSGSCGCRK